MSWSNFHSHTHYCDGTDAPESYIQQAIQLGFRVWGVSSHAPVPFACKSTMKENNLVAYLNEIRSLSSTYQDQIRIFSGLEVDFVPQVTGPGRIRSLASDLDYTIGSVHFVDQLPDGTPWEVDGPHSIFLNGLSQIFGNSAPHAIRRYYALIRQMAETDAPDVIGHLDKIIIQNEEGALFSDEAPWYREAVSVTLETIRSQNLIVEVNTRGIYKGLVKFPYPTRWILELMHDMGIAITLNSDAHHPREIAGAFPETAQLLREIGFRHLHILLDGSWQPVPFDRWGIRVDDPTLLMGT